MRETGGRHEIKHYINHSDLLQLRARLPYIMKRDEHTDGSNGYRIRSLYFDNYSDKVLREKLDGVDDREKFRFRFYNDDPSFIRLEKKTKKSGLCYKHSAEVSAQTCHTLLNGNPDFDPEELKHSENQLLTELHAKMRYEMLRPKNIVDYRREAFVYPAGNVRVTLDYDIRSCFNTADFMNPQYVSVPLPGTIILEVKYDNFLPEIIRGIATLSSRQATAFSKYAAARII